MEPAMTKEELAEVNELENHNWVERVHFWVKKYHKTTGADHMKALVRNYSDANIFIFRIIYRFCSNCRKTCALSLHKRMEAMKPKKKGNNSRFLSQNESFMNAC